MGLWTMRTPAPERNPLVDLVRFLPGPGRRALYAAATTGDLGRGSWEGCALNRAGTEVGLPVRSRGEAALALGTSTEVVRRFVETWDRQWGSNRRCSRMLCEALEHVGLFDDAEVVVPVAEPV